MSALYYLLEANLYLAIFYCFYRLLLGKETFYRLNRAYLLITTLIAFIIPFLAAGYFHPRFPPPEVITYSVTETTAAFPAPVVTLIQEPAFDYAALVPYIYIVITAAFFVKLLLSIISVVRLVRKCKMEKEGNITFVALREPADNAFSFFNLLFINPQLREEQTVINHELVHIRQKHSLDVMFFEVVQAICWFNPLVWLLKADVKLLHEFLADERTTAFHTDKHEYAMFLIRNSFGVPASQLTNNIFNQSILKRRISMLNKKKTTPRARLRLLLLLPLAGAMVGLSTMAFTKEYGIIDVYPEKYTQIVQVPAQTKKVTAPPRPQLKISEAVSKNSDGTFNYRPVKKGNITPLYVLNGKITPLQFLGEIKNAAKITELNAAAALKKYGKPGTNGAVEVFGKPDIVKFPPPIAKSYKFPPPVVKRDVIPPPRIDVVNLRHPSVKGRLDFYIPRKWDPSKRKLISTDERLIFVNGVQQDQEKFLGVSNLSSKTELSGEAAIKKYGAAGKPGAVEITGDSAKVYYQPLLLPPPPIEPPPPRLQKRPGGKLLKNFPPPAVKNDVKAFIPKQSFSGLTGYVVKKNQKLSFQADSMFVSKDQSEVSLTGNVIIKIGEQKLTGDEAYYNKLTGKLNISNAKVIF